MRIPARFAPILFGALLSGVMVMIVSAFVLAQSQGIDAGFAAKWFKSCITTWPVAFVSVTLLAPWVRKVVARVTTVPSSDAVKTTKGDLTPVSATIGAARSRFRK